MTQEDKKLLLQDLCARLPYNVVMTNKFLPQTYYILTGKDLDEAYFDDEWDDIPYLRPMSSMTEEENEEYIKRNLYGFHWNFVDWCNSKHLDYRGLIPKGLAIAVTKENDPYK